MADDDAIVDPRLIALLARGGIGSDALMPVGPAIRPMASNPVYSLGGRRMEGQRPLTNAELTMPRAAAELTGIPQAASAIGEAYQDPSIPNLTNAGVRTGMAAMRPVAALATLGTGLTAAALKDAGAFDFGAEAQTKKGAAPKEIMPGLSSEQQSVYDAAKKRLESGDYDPAERGTLKQTMDLLLRQSIDFQNKNADAIRAQEAQKKAADLAEYNRQVGRAETARNSELARDRRFSETDVGKTWNKTGGLAPALFGFAPGVVNRLAYGGNKVVPSLIEGALAGGAAYQIPLAYDAFGTEADNPKKRAYEAYALELPPNHPRRQEWLDYAAGLPKNNPLREAAADELYDLKKAGERAFAGGIEGGLGAALGYGGAHIGAKVGSSISSLPGRLWAALRGQPEVPSTTSGPAGGTPSLATVLSQPSTAGAGSAAEILPPTSARPSLAERVRAPSPLPETDQTLQLARVLAQDQLPSPSTPSSSDLARTLAAPANRNVPKKAEVRPGVDRLGRPYHKDPDDGRFTSGPDKD